MTTPTPAPMQTASDPHARPCVLTTDQSIASLQQLLAFYADKEAEYYARLWGPEPDERWDQGIETEWMRYRIEAGSLRAGIAALEQNSALVAALIRCMEIAKDPESFKYDIQAEASNALSELGLHPTQVKVAALKSAQGEQP